MKQTRDSLFFEEKGVRKLLRRIVLGLSIGVFLALPAVAQDPGPPETDDINPGDVLLFISTVEDDPQLGEVERRDVLRMVPPAEEGEDATLYTLSGGAESIFWSLETSSSLIFVGSGAPDTVDFYNVCCDDAAGCPIGILVVDPNDDDENALEGSMHTIQQGKCGVYNDLQTVDDDRLLGLRSEFSPADDTITSIVFLYDTETGEGCEMTSFQTHAPFARITSDGENSGWATRNTCEDVDPFHCETELLEFPLDEGCLQGHESIASIGESVAFPGDPVYANDTVLLPRVEPGLPTTTTWWGHLLDGGVGFIQMPDLGPGNWSEEAAMYRQVGVGGNQFYAFATSCLGEFGAVACWLRSDDFDFGTDAQDTILDYTDPTGNLLELTLLDAVVSRVRAPEPASTWGALSALVALAGLASRRKSRRR